MYEVISIVEKEKWQSIVTAFDDYDVYFDCSYLCALSRYTNTDVRLFHYTEGDFEGCYAMQINDISDAMFFRNRLEKGKFFDMETPYGYGGLMVRNPDETALKNFTKHTETYCAENGIVSQFFRFNPLTENHKYSRNVSEIVRQKSTVSIDLRDSDTIWANMDSKNRNMVRKAEKSGVEIRIAENFDSFVVEEFKRLYRETMDRNQADSFYYFDDAYFERFFTDMNGKYRIFYAVAEGKIIAASIVMFEKKYLHYFLSGADRAYMNLAPNNLLLYRAALWGCERGFREFHLGGGVSDNDKLFSFKKAFHKTGIKDFYIGRNIFDRKTFDNLVRMRKDADADFDLERKFMIKYRQE